MPISNPVYTLQGQSGGAAQIDTVTDPLQIIGTDLSIKDASTVQKGSVQLVSDISDTTSTDKAPTVSYIKELINDSLINPNNIANVNYATLTDISLTGSVTYLGQVIPTNTRVIVLGQTDATTNGIYLSDDGGAWARTTDADTIEKLYLSQTISVNATKGLYLCTIPKDAVLGVSEITFIQLYQTNDDTIGVRLYQPSTIYNVNDLVVNPSVNGFIFKCLINGTNSIPPDMASANWEIYQGLLYQNSAIVAPNGDDDKSEGFPYLTYTGAIVDMLIDAYIEGRAVTNTETITPKQGMKLSGKNVQVNNLIVNVDDVKCDGIIFANTIGTAAGMSVTGATNSQFINCSVSNGTNAYAINLGGTWDGVHKFLNLDVTGNIQVIGTTATGVVHFENINNALTLTINCANAKVYISNCPNITIVNTLSSSVSVDGIINPVSTNIVIIDTTLQQKDSGKKFSTDGTFAGDSDNNMPTEKAIKTFVSTAITPAADATSVTGTIAVGVDINQVTTNTSITRTLPSAATKIGKKVTVSNMSGSALSAVVTVLGAPNATTLYRSESVTMFSNGTNWTPINLSQRNLAGSVIRTLAAPITTDLTAGNHSPFNTTFATYDPYALFVHGTSAYTISNGVNCIGRTLIKAGYIYEIIGVLSSTATASFFGYSIYNAASGTKIGTAGSGFASTNQDINVQSIPTFAQVTVTSDLLVEVRLTGGTLVAWYPGNSNLSECSMSIKVIGRIS